MIYLRTIGQSILDACYKGKAVIIYGARQVGKTTLCKTLWADSPHTLYVTGDDFSLVSLLTDASLATLRDRLHGYSLVIIDEAQKIKTIGNTIKLIVDNIPHVQVVATGSSSFDLANHLQEPLTGRTSTFHLHPLSREEITGTIPLHEHTGLLHQKIIFGMYPGLQTNPNPKQLIELVSAYAYKDIFLYEHLKKPDLIIKLLQALALQIGSEVSYNELSQLLAVDIKTIQKYIGLLEQSFIIFRLPSFARNLRNEIKKGQKIYFWDTGVRNGLLKNTTPILSRTDIGALWENFIIAERLKHIQNHHQYCNSFFRRTLSGTEIDYIETDYDTRIDTYEIKRSPTKKSSLPRSFSDQYPHATHTIVNTQTYRTFILP